MRRTCPYRAPVFSFLLLPLSSNRDREKIEPFIDEFLPMKSGDELRQYRCWAVRFGQMKLKHFSNDYKRGQYVRATDAGNHGWKAIRTPMSLITLLLESRDESRASIPSAYLQPCSIKFYGISVRMCVLAWQKGIVRERTRGYYWTFIEKKPRDRKMSMNKYVAMNDTIKTGLEMAAELASRQLLSPQDFRN